MSTLTTPPKKLNFEKDPILVELATDSAGEDNLTASITIDDVSNGSEFVSRITPPYKADGTLTTNLSDIFDMLPPLPDEAFSGAVKRHDNSFRTYEITHTDRFGSPPANADNGGTSEPFVVVRGASRYFGGFGRTDAIIDAEPWFLMHSYSVNDFRQVRAVKKVVNASQPEPVYFYNNSAGALTINYSARLYDDEGQLISTESGSFNLSAPGLHNGYLSLDQIKPANDDVVSYAVDFTAGGKTRTIEYLVNSAPNDFVILGLYENGCGGMETVRFIGRHKFMPRSKGQIATSPVWSGFSFDNGQNKMINIQGNESLELNTGYYPREYIQHLANAFLFSDLWLIDPSKNRLFRYNVETRQLPAIDDTELLNNLTLSITPATNAHTLNTFNQ